MGYPGKDEMMNKRKADLKRTGRLLVLLFLLFAVAAALIILKINGKADPEGTAREEESYPVIQIDSSKVKEIGIINREETVNLIREGEEWKCREKETEDAEEVSIDSSLVDEFLAKATSVTASEKIENVTDLSQYGLEDPSVNITLQWDDNMYIIRLGDYNSIIGSYYLSLNEEGTVYLIDSSLYYGLNKTLEDFRKTETEVSD